MKKFTLAVIISCFAIASAHAGGIGDNSYTDSDWNTSMYNWDNDYLHGQDIEWVSYNGDKAIQFTLVGGNPGIADDYRPTNKGALFRERNELHSRYFNRDNHIINFTFSLLEGFSGRKETFFQIHSYNENCAVQPTLLLQVHKGMIIARTKAHAGQGKGSYNTTILTHQVMGEWSDVQIKTHKADKDYMQYTITSKNLGIDLQLPASYIAPCGRQYIKFGIYRPSFLWKTAGKIITDGTNKTSVVQFDNLNITKY